ncbi:MAG: DUF2065 domain-containing protein [Dongiaceae bacterium]
MSSGVGDLLTAIGLVLVLEGLALALMPEQAKRAMAEILARPSATLRFGGIVVLAAGVFVVWLVRG